MRISHKTIGAFYLLLSFGCLIYSIKDFTASHPLHSGILTAISVLLIVCALGLIKMWRWTILVFTLFWLNALLAYVASGLTGLGINYILIVSIATLLVPYYYSVAKERLFRRAPNQAL